MKKLYGGVVLLMAGITALSLGITAFTGSFRREEAGEFSVVASFYPMYTAALNLTQGIEAVRVTCLAQPQTGCLHDYQLSPDNMITLQEADLLIINGAGAESFLDQALGPDTGSAGGGYLRRHPAAGNRSRPSSRGGGNP